VTAPAQSLEGVIGDGRVFRLGGKFRQCSDDLLVVAADVLQHDGRVAPHRRVLVRALC